MAPVAALRARQSVYEQLFNKTQVLGKFVLRKCALG